MLADAKESPVWTRDWSCWVLVMSELEVIIDTWGRHDFQWAFVVSWRFEVSAHSATEWTAEDTRMIKNLYQKFIECTNLSVSNSKHRQITCIYLLFIILYVPWQKLVSGLKRVWDGQIGREPHHNLKYKQTKKSVSVWFSKILSVYWTVEQFLAFCG